MKPWISFSQLRGAVLSPYSDFLRRQTMPSRPKPLGISMNTSSSTSALRNAVGTSNCTSSDPNRAASERANQPVLYIGVRAKTSWWGLRLCRSPRIVNRALWSATAPCSSNFTLYTSL